MTLERHETADYGWTANKGRLLCRMYGAQLASSRISHQFFFFLINFLSTTETFRHGLNILARL